MRSILSGVTRTQGQQETLRCRRKEEGISKIEREQREEADRAERGYHAGKTRSSGRVALILILLVFLFPVSDRRGRRCAWGSGNDSSVSVSSGIQAGVLLWGLLSELWEWESGASACLPVLQLLQF